MTTQDNTDNPNLCKIFGQLPTARESAERVAPAETNRRLTALEEHVKAQENIIQALVDREFKPHPLKAKPGHAKPTTGKVMKQRHKGRS
jgi:hypothetical protein